MTFDLDWAIDEVIDDFCDLMHGMDISGVIHITHPTKRLQILREDDSLELGIHPNYNPLLLSQENEVKANNIEEVLAYMKDIVPEAVCCRSHALTYSSVIAAKYPDYGIKYDLNHYIRPIEGTRIYPYRVGSSDGIVTIIPFIFEDDIWLDDKTKWEVDYYLGDHFEAPMIFNFHPIHLFLNTDKIERYNMAKERFNDYEWLESCKNTETYGVRDFFVEFVTKAKREGGTFKRVSEKDWE